MDRMLTVDGEHTVTPRKWATVVLEFPVGEVDEALLFHLCRSQLPMDHVPLTQPIVQTSDHFHRDVTMARAYWWLVPAEYALFVHELRMAFLR